MYYYKNDHCNDSIFWLFYSEKCAKVQSHIARPKTSHTHAHRTHSFKPVPHALPHAHCTCVSAIIRTCVPQPNICLLRGSCTNKSQFFFYIYIQWYILLIFFFVDFINLYFFDHTVFDWFLFLIWLLFLILITLFLIMDLLNDELFRATTSWASKCLWPKLDPEGDTNY